MIARHTANSLNCPVIEQTPTHPGGLPLASLSVVWVVAKGSGVGCGWRRPMWTTRVWWGKSVDGGSPKPFGTGWSTAHRQLTADGRPALYDRRHRAAD
jgi:hypothetical protein